MCSKRVSLPATGEEPVIRVILDLPVPVVVALESGAIVAANPGAKALLGDLAHRSLGDVLPDPAEAVSGAEVRLRHADGGEVWALASVGAVEWHGEPARVLIFQELTAQKACEEQLRQARDDAEQAVRAKMRFFAAASHDLRQPLQALALFVSALEKQVATPQAFRIFASLKVSLRSMEEMFESLLDMSRLDAGVLKPDPAVFLVSDLLETLETEFAAQAQQAGLRFRVIYSSLAVQSDQTMLARILRNFISNAIRYTRKGGLLLGCRRRGRFLRFEVWDSGAGIPLEQQQEIFSEFFQGKAATKRKGSGLGLAIVQRLARLLGHRLDLRSVEGKGTVFAVEVPLADLPAGERLHDDEDAIGSADVSGVTVVVVDDDVEILEGVRLLLEQWGSRAVTARSPEEAVKRLAREMLVPDLILADFKLHTSETGLDTIRVLRQAVGREVPAFVFTGSTADDSQTQDFPVLRKPLNPARLRAVLAGVRG